MYVDANAVSPETARRVGEIVGRSGATFVDGGIIGPPPQDPGRTRLYLAGSAAGRVAALFGGTPLATIVLEAPPGAASAVKMCYAAWRKGTAALLTSVRAVARAEAVDVAFADEGRISQPDFFRHASAQVFARLEAFKDARGATLEELPSALTPMTPTPPR